MRRLLTLGSLVVVCVLSGAAAAAQSARPLPQPVTQLAAAVLAELHGVVVDDRGLPVAGAVVSALGGTTVFAVSDREGRFTFRNLQPGPYLLRAHLQGYIPAHGRITQVNANARNSSRLSLARRERGDDQPGVLEAGVGPSTGGTPDSASEGAGHDHGEVAWRLRHLRRSVLRDAEPVFGDWGEDDLPSDVLAGVGRVVAGPARLATALLSEVPFSGQINLLTTASFHRPEELFTGDRPFPRGIAQLAVSAPTVGGEWTMQGGLTQGDLSSWTIEGSFQRVGATPHLYEAGMSYGMQRYMGSNADALAAVTDGGRSAGAVYAFDTWTVNPQLTVGYGARYARYDYLAERALLSPRASVSVRPSSTDSLRITARAARREHAPGAEEFLPPSNGVWLPPERTFSPLSLERGFRPERVEHVEIAGEREMAGDILLGLRAFRQHVDDQLVTMFGVAPPGRTASNLGHYYVASGGDFEAKGWSVSVGRRFTEGVRASVDYTQVDTHWDSPSAEAGMLATVAASALRMARERVHDLTASLDSEVPATATRVFMVFKVNSGFASTDQQSPHPVTGARFDVQVNQGLPFMNFGSAQWEMLIAVQHVS